MRTSELLVPPGSLGGFSSLVGIVSRGGKLTVHRRLAGPPQVSLFADDALRLVSFGAWLTDPASTREKIDAAREDLICPLSVQCSRVRVGAPAPWLRLSSLRGPLYRSLLWRTQ